MQHRVLMAIICLFLHGINTSLSYLCKTYITIFIYAIIAGIFYGTYNALYCVAIIDCVRAENIAQAFGFAVASNGFGVSIGPPIAGKVINYLLLPKAKNV